MYLHSAVLVVCCLVFTAGSRRVLVEMSHPYDDRTASPPDPLMWKYELQNMHKGPWEGHGNIW